MTQTTQTTTPASPTASPHAAEMVTYSAVSRAATTPTMLTRTRVPPAPAPWRCGDGHIQAGVEACDDANNLNTDARLTTCQRARCGDGHVQAGVEACDDANNSNADACLTNCSAAAAAMVMFKPGLKPAMTPTTATPTRSSPTAPPPAVTGMFERREACDDGNNSQTDGCLTNCTAALRRRSRASGVEPATTQQQQRRRMPTSSEPLAAVMVTCKRG